jgi:Xaa-Pro aminopeptidase
MSRRLDGGSQRAEAPALPAPERVPAEAKAKRRDALDAAGPFVANDPADVRWLLCGRGRPVSAGSASYTVDVTEDAARVWYRDIEHSRVEAEERWEELGYEAVPYPWHEPLPVRPTAPALQPLRLDLRPDEVERYRAAAADASAALVDALRTLHPRTREVEAIAAVAERLVGAGFTTPVLLAGGERRAPVHRHPLPTEEPLGADAIVLPATCAVAFNPSVTGGGKSEDTVLVGEDGVEVLTHTPSLPALPNGRPAIVEL